MVRTLLELAARVGRPGVLLRLGDSGGRLLFLEARTGPELVAVALEREDVVRLVSACSRWLDERDGIPPPRPAPLIAGRIARGVQDAATVQSCTVARP
jgi:hypothetical protein